MVIKIKYATESSKVIKVTYDTTPIYISTSVSSVYIKVYSGLNTNGGTVRSIATTAPITGGTITTTGTIGITQSGIATDGYLSSADWNTFNNKQNVLTNPITGTGTVNYVPKFTGASALADSNIQDSGSLITLGTALQATSTAIFNNSMALGTALQANSLFFINKALGGNTFANGISIGSPVSSAVTALARYFNASTSTDAGFTLTELINYNARQGTFLSPVVDQIGFNVESTMSGATNNYAFRGNINSAANSWNFYANGTALNFMRGALLVGSSVDDTINKLQITGSAIVSSSITANSFIKSGGTSAQILAADGSVITAGTNITISGGTISAAGSGGTVTSVGLTMPAAFAVANSPITGAGTLAVTAIGTASQYIRGDGSLATIPSTSSGGSSVNYYLNGSVAASVAGYKKMSNSAIIGAGTDFTLVGNGLIAQFLTDVANPNRLLIPGGAWNFEMYFNVSSSGGNQKFYVELLKYDGTTFTSIASTSAVPEEITGGTTVDLYLTSLAVPETILLATDRLAVRVYIVDNSGGRTITLHTEDNTLCEIITTFSGGISALNGLTANTQYFATGTSGTDFAISSATDTHTFNLPTASAANRGALSSADWTTFNGKFNLPSLTSGSVLFSNGTTIAQDNANFFWDDTNNRLGIGTATPSAILHSVGSITATSALARGNYMQPTLVASANNDVLVGLDIAPTFTVGAFTGTTILGLRVNGTARFSGGTIAGAIFGSGATVNLASDAYMFATSTTGKNAGYTANRFSTSEYASFDLITGASYLAGWSIQMRPSQTRLDIVDRYGTENVRMSFFSGGNVSINSTTDAGFRLDVNGTTRLQGNATLSAALNVTGVTTLTDIAAIGTAVTQNNLNINRAITGAVTANGVQVSSQVAGTVTTAARYFSAISSTAAGTLTDLFNFRAAQGTFTGTVTNQYGYFVDATLIGATNNYGFRGAIPAAANRWNLYMDGTAINYLNGALLVGSATDDTINKLQVTGGAKVTNLILGAGTSSITPINFTTGVLKTTPASGDMEVNNGYLFYTQSYYRGVISPVQWIANTSTRTFTTLSTAQNLFDIASAGADSFTVKENTTYFFEAEIFLTNLASTTTVSFGFNLTTAVISNINYTAIVLRQNNMATPSPANMCRITTNSLSVITITSTQTGASIRISGVVRITTGGTLTPIVAHSGGSAYVLGLGSYVKFSAVGSNTDTKNPSNGWV
jgi:hypothetical protein